MPPRYLQDQLPAPYHGPQCPQLASDHLGAPGPLRVQYTELPGAPQSRGAMSQPTRVLGLSPLLLLSHSSYLIIFFLLTMLIHLLSRFS